ncbi:hypothetical protein HDU88_002311 [Geranomyces variabilis]|nr:hypothetical protein HDU88_002311 [Geranomyces variabilis]
MTFIVEPMHRQPLTREKLSGWVYDYTKRITVRVLSKQKAAITLKTHRRWIEDQVLIGTSRFGHYVKNKENARTFSASRKPSLILTFITKGHWLLDEGAPMFRLMRRWGRLDYNSRILTLSPTAGGGPANVGDAWSSVVRNPPSSLFKEVEKAEAAGEMLCVRNIMWGAQIGAFAARYDYYDHFAWRDWALEHMEISVPRPKKPKLLFASRPCPGSRCIVNETQLIDMLREKFKDLLEVEVINFSGQRLRTQIELLQSATILMGASGTGMHNGLWMRNGSVVIDIVTDTVSKQQIETEYFVNAHLCGANSPSVILCLPFKAQPVSDLSRDQLENHEDSTMVRNLPIQVDLVKLWLMICNHALIYGLNEELINETLSEFIFNPGE